MSHHDEILIGNAALAAANAVREALQGSRLNAERIAGSVFELILQDGREEYERVYGKPSSYPLATVGHDAQGED